MIDFGKKSILGIRVSAVDYEAAVDATLNAARLRVSFLVSALAVHGVMTGVLDPTHRFRLNQFDLIVPDGQPVRWALNLLHRTDLLDRVYGPELMRRLCRQAAEEGLAIYLYGSTMRTLDALSANLKARFPRLEIAGVEPSKFRHLLPHEKEQVVERIRKSRASLVFIGLGCPRQEVWAYEYRTELDVPLVAVGAAFNFFAGDLKQAPTWMQDRGLEWFFRLSCEPTRLWKRYAFLNPAFLALLSLQAVGLWNFNENGIAPAEELLYG